MKGSWALQEFHCHGSLANSDSTGEGLGEIRPLKNTGLFWKCLRSRLTCAAMVRVALLP